MDAYKNILNPPEKVLLMYTAVSELVRKNDNIEAIKVSDITTKAGIGKGTAYEYFKSKEELITCALVYEYGGKLKRLEEKVFSKTAFSERYQVILDWILENRDYNALFIKMFKVNLGLLAPDEMKDKLPPELVEGVGTYIGSLITKMMREGNEEGIFTEKDTSKQSMALLMSVMQYAFYVGGNFLCMTQNMTDEQTRTFAYESLVKTLN